MSKARKGHQQKTTAERKDYFDNVIREAAPTLEPSDLAFDSTDQTATTSGPERVGRPTPSKAEGWLVRRFREDPFLTIAAPLLVIFLGWGAYQIYSLNREVGEVGTRVDSFRENQEHLRNDLQRVDERAQRGIDRNAEAIERVQTQKQGANQ